jgi:hypothetical protein
LGAYRPLHELDFSAKAAESDTDVGTQIMNEKILIGASWLAVAMPFFFWVRGIVRGSKGDLAAGVVLLVVISLGAMMVVGHSGVFSGIGGLLLLFGLATLIAGSFAKPDCPIKRKDRIAVAMLFIILGILGSMII